MTQFQNRAESLFQRFAQAKSDAQTEAQLEGRSFSLFNQDDVMEAGQLAVLMSLRARAQDSDQVELSEALDLIESLTDRNPKLLFHALALFSTHDAAARVLRKPRMMTLQPKTVLPAARPGGGAEGATGPEAILDYWRENPLANEHHQHWHEVYPGIGVQRPIADIPPAIVAKVQAAGTLTVLDADELRQVFRLQDRHGELFVYMHQQMLARYNAERLSNNLATVASLNPDDLTAMIPEGFSPGPDLAADFGARPQGTQMPVSAADVLAGWVDAIEAAIAVGALPLADGGSKPITASDLGDQIEAVHSIWRGNVDEDALGNLHNTGHGVLASLSAGQSGVMNSTETAIRDPIFYRWHKLVDDISTKWQNTQPALDLSDAPPATLPGADTPWSSPSILLLKTDSLPKDANGAFDQTASEELAETLFGGSNWKACNAAGPVTGSQGETVTILDKLTTMLRVAEFPDPQNPGANIDVPYPVHEAFTYALRLENPTPVSIDVTVRIFLAPESEAEDRKAWIEMDKFPVNLAAGSKRVVVRSDTEASIVKKPVDAFLAPDLLSDIEGDPRCDCGWPYTLLLPKGSFDGMPCRLMVMLTDTALDQVSAAGTCVSLSFCGAKDDIYPDRREMGYPFNRPWAGSISDIVSATPSMAGRAVTIEHVFESG